MLRHYLLIAVRNLRRHKSSFFINWIGLSTGLACAFLIYLWVNDEWNFDKFHANDSRLYQVMEKNKISDEIQVHESTQGLLATSMQKDLPEVESAVTVMDLKKVGIYFQMRTTDKVVKTGGLSAGRDFFRMFSFPLLRGRPDQVLADKNGIVLSEEMADKLFGGADKAMGRTVSWEVMGKKEQSVVTGVAARLSAKSSLTFDFVFTHELLLSDLWPNGNKWWNEGPATYLLLKPRTDITAFNTKIADFIKRYQKDSDFSLFVRPYSSAYLYGRYENGVVAGGRIEYVRIFSVVAIIILVIACINFMNLSTAKASRRAKEVGIKKVMGSSRAALIYQFLTEAALTAILSFFLALLIVALLLPVFNQVTGKHLDETFTAPVLATLLGITLLTGVLAGSYPAFYLSGFRPILVLKGKLRNSILELLTRKGLVVFQFTISLVLIVSMIIIYQQVAYVQSKNLGYDREHVVYFDKEGALAQNQDAFLAGLRKVPGVVSAATMEQNIVQADLGSSTYGIGWPGKPKDLEVNFGVRALDYGVLQTMGIQLKEGRDFSPAFGVDSTKLLCNETAVRIMGLKNPVGTTIRMWGRDMTIIGVMKDFHVTSLHDPILPMVFYFNPTHTSTIIARIAGNEQQTLLRIAALYKRFNPGYVFEYKFQDQTYQALYVSEQRVSLLSRYFAGLAILISCLGLSGLAAFNAESRTKEIGIRKVLGASVGSVTLLLSRSFVSLMVLAMLIAFPLTWWLMHAWLAGFAYRIDIGWGVFVIAGISLVVITLSTVSYQSIKAAVINPADSLRSE
ncbi:MAG: ABC transporter permease [Chitinophagaceae bacterium]|nr:ABC transporter permease [Chitinophagaceae bacterium]